ncbi:MAG TPA: hypothetical protein EYP21_06195 [Syntrophaceae bacterium]|nr:hypothetical protein [Syntrophaceae bacterium]
MNALFLIASAIIMAIAGYQILKAIARSQWVNKGNPLPALKIGAISKEEIINELKALRGRKIALHYQKTVHGVEKAYHMVNRMLTQVGAQCVDSPYDAEVVARIYAGQSYPFAYTIDGPPRHSKSYSINGECVPRFLTPAVLLGICHFLKQLDAERGRV